MGKVAKDAEYQICSRRKEYHVSKNYTEIWYKLIQEECKKKNPKMPRCPKCGGKMIDDSGFLIEGAKCTKCNFGVAECGGLDLMVTT